ncbi:MAG: hypothetical protein RIR26_2652 [Pseudomonadota bacterium]|jgi:HlyD family secretion protein
MTFKIKKKGVLGALIFAVTAVLFLIYNRRKSTLILAALATRGELTVEVTDSGFTRFRSVHTVLAPQNGWISVQYVNLGEKVEENESQLATMWASQSPLIDVRTREVLQQQAEAARAQFKQSKSQIQRIELLRTATQDELRRTESVLVAGAASVQDVNRLRNRLAELSSELESARAAADVAQHSSQAAAAALSSSRRTTSVDSQILKAPVSGVISWIYDEKPRFVTLGTPLFDIARLGEMTFEIDLLAQDSLSVQAGQSVRFTESNLRGRVRRISPTALAQTSPLGISEQRVRVWIDFDSPVPPVWPAGLELEAHIQTLTRKNVVKIPLSATWEENVQPFVFAIRDGTLKKTRLTLGARNAIDVEILEGLSEGDAVARLPTEDMKEGQRVSTGI